MNSKNLIQISNQGGITGTATESNKIADNVGGGNQPIGGPKKLVLKKKKTKAMMPVMMGK